MSSKRRWTLTSTRTPTPNPINPLFFKTHPSSNPNKQLKDSKFMIKKMKGWFKLSSKLNPNKMILSNCLGKELSQKSSHDFNKKILKLRSLEIERSPGILIWPTKRDRVWFVMKIRQSLNIAHRKAVLSKMKRSRTKLIVKVKNFLRLEPETTLWSGKCRRWKFWWNKKCWPKKGASGSWSRK